MRAPERSKKNCGMEDGDAFVTTSGSLKLKRSVSVKDDKKSKKKKKQKKKQKVEEAVAAAQPAAPQVEMVPVEAPRMTAHEAAFQEKRRRMENARLEKLASKTHRQRVSEFNGALAKLTEHNDLPKVGPG